MRLTRSAAPALALALAVATTGLAACGDEVALTREEFIEEGDEVCGRIDERFDEIGLTQQTLEEIQPERTDELLLAARSAVSEGVGDFRQLQAPPDGRVVKGEITLRLRQVEDAMQRALRSVLRTRAPGAHSEGFGEGGGDLAELAEGQEPGDSDGDADRYGESVRTVQDLLDAVHEQAADYGFDACARDWISG